MLVFVCVHTVTIGAKNFALVDLQQQFVHRYFRVLANAKCFVAMNVVEIKRSRMRVISAYRATALSFNFVD
jgi:hypothetical protein